MIGPSARIDIGTLIRARAEGGAPASMTAGPLTLRLPRGSTLRSESGAFLTAAVPEPASWAMLIAGFGLVGTTARRRRTGGAVPA